MQYCTVIFTHAQLIQHRHNLCAAQTERMDCADDETCIMHGLCPQKYTIQVPLKWLNTALTRKLIFDGPLANPWGDLWLEVGVSQSDCLDYNQKVNLCSVTLKNL